MGLYFGTHGGLTFISRSLIHHYDYDIYFSKSDFRVSLGCIFILVLKWADVSPLVHHFIIRYKSLISSNGDDRILLGLVFILVLTAGGRYLLSSFHHHGYDTDFSKSDFRVSLGCVFILVLKFGGRFCSRSLFYN